MDQVNSFLEQIKASDNPMIYYIIAAVILLVAAIVLRSLIGTMIMIVGAGVLILIVLYATGHPLPKIDLEKLNLPDFSKLLPTTDSSSKSPNDTKASPDPLKKLSLPDIPDDLLSNSKDPLKDAIIKGREERKSKQNGGIMIPGF